MRQGSSRQSIAHELDWNSPEFMTKDLIAFLCDPDDQSELQLVEEVVRRDDEIESGVLASIKTGRKYALKNRVPRFNDDEIVGDSVESVGEEWSCPTRSTA